MPQSELCIDLAGPLMVQGKILLQLYGSGSVVLQMAAEKTLWEGLCNDSA